MTNLQLLFAAGMPTLAVLIALLTNVIQISGLRSDIHSLGGRIDGLSKRVDDLGSSLGARIDALNLRMDADGRSVRGAIDLLTGKIIELVDRISKLEGRMENH